LTLAKKRKTVSGYVEIKPQLIETKEVLKELELTKEQLTCLAILSGTDYNPGGVRGIGPKKALKLVKEHKTKDKIFAAVENFEKEGKYKLDFDWKEVFELMKNPDVDEKYKITAPKFDEKKVKQILVEHDFSEERIESQFEKFREMINKNKQKTLF
jgi:flap endonuclease-1